MNDTKKSQYELSLKQLEGILKEEQDPITIMSTINCVLKTNLDYYFWVGFYLYKNNSLKVGPYQGTLGCLNIEIGKGVCGTTAKKRQTIIVENVHEFPGHIACDSASCSEIVVPVFTRKNELYAVFDVDSTAYNSFDQTDQNYLEKILNKFLSPHI